MNCPPPVRFPLRHSPQWGGVIVGVWLLALISLLAALALHAPARSDTPALLIALTALVLSGGLALHLWRSQVSGALVWNGAQWFLDQGGAMTIMASPSVRFDGQRWLLLRTRMDRRRAWLWVGRSADSSCWHALRCAVYAQVPAPQALA